MESTNFGSVDRIAGRLLATFNNRALFLMRWPSGYLRLPESDPYFHRHFTDIIGAESIRPGRAGTIAQATGRPVEGYAGVLFDAVRI